MSTDSPDQLIEMVEREGHCRIQINYSALEFVGTWKPRLIFKLLVHQEKLSTSSNHTMLIVI